MNNMIGFSIVGCGYIGNRHAEHISMQDKLIACCDIQEHQRKKFISKFQNVQAFSSIEAMLENDNTSQVVSICTPNGLHKHHTILALKKGKHVLCEKPMALNSVDCEEMIKTASENNKMLFIVKQNRYNPPVAAVKEILNKGVLGKIISVQLNCFWNRNERYYTESNWKGTKAIDGGILFTQFSHFIDLLLWFTGDFKTVCSYQKNYLHQGITEFDDTVVSIVEFENGAIGTINCTINSYQKNMEGSITLFGTKGSIKIGGQYLNVLEYQNIENYQIETIETMQPANDYGYYQGSMSNHDKVIKNVIDVIKNKDKIAVSGEEGKKTVEMIEKMLQSCK